MQTNLNDYNKRATWVPPQNQPYSSRYILSQDGGPQFGVPQNLAQVQRPRAQKPKAPAKMPRERAMALANKFKRGFAVASILGFGTLSGLVALHQVGSTATQSSSGSSSTNSSSSSNSTNSSSQSSNHFFNQQGGNTSGTSSSSSSSSSSTVSGTRTS